MLLTDQDVKERNLIWEYFRIDPKDNKKVLCVTCGESISHRGTTAKTTIPVTCDTRAYITKFEELELK